LGVKVKNCLASEIDNDRWGRGDKKKLERPIIRCEEVGMGAKAEGDSHRPMGWSRRNCMLKTGKRQKSVKAVGQGGDHTAGVYERSEKNANPLRGRAKTEITKKHGGSGG